MRQGFSPELSSRLLDALSIASATFLTSALETGKLCCILAPTAIMSSENTSKNDGKIDENLLEELSISSQIKLVSYDE